MLGLMIVELVAYMLVFLSERKGIGLFVLLIVLFAIAKESKQVAFCIIDSFERRWLKS